MLALVFNVFTFSNNLSLWWFVLIAVESSFLQWIQIAYLSRHHG